MLLPNAPSTASSYALWPSLVSCTRFARREVKSFIKILASSLSRPPTNRDGISLVSASIAVQVQNVASLRR